MWDPLLVIVLLNITLCIFHSNTAHIINIKQCVVKTLGAPIYPANSLKVLELAKCVILELTVFVTVFV